MIVAGTVSIVIGTLIILYYSFTLDQLGLVFAWLMFVLASLFLGSDAYEEGYKNGQVDAIQGEIKYELRITKIHVLDSNADTLRTTQDSTWVEK